MALINGLLGLVLVVLFINTSAKTFLLAIKPLREPLIIRKEPNKIIHAERLFNLCLLYFFTISMMALFIATFASTPALVGNLYQHFEGYPPVEAPPPGRYFPLYEPVSNMDSLLAGIILSAAAFVVTARVLALKHNDFLIDTILYQILTLFSIFIFTLFLSPQLLVIFSDLFLNSFRGFVQYLVLTSVIAFTVTELLLLLFSNNNSRLAPPNS